MAGLTQNKLKCFIFIVVLKAGKVLVRLNQNEEKKEKKEE